MSSRETRWSSSQDGYGSERRYKDHKSHQRSSNHPGRDGDVTSPENHDSRQQSVGERNSKKFEKDDRSYAHTGSSYSDTSSASVRRNSGKARPFTISNTQSAAETNVHTKSGTFDCRVISPHVKSENQSDSDVRNDTSGGKEKKGKSIKEVTGDLFTAKDNVSLVHCVGADFRMGSGIAVHFQEKFGSVGELFDQKVGPGGVAYLKRDQRYVFYLVTKQASKDKPTNDTMRQSLIALRNKCKKLNVTELAMPQIGCGLDGLLWEDVKQMLLEIFMDDITITVYLLEMHFVREPKHARKSYVKNEKLILNDIDSGTGLLYIGCVDNSVTDEMKSLNERYPFIHHLNKRSRQLGSVFRSWLGDQDMYGLICKQSAKKPLNYNYLEAALKQLNNQNECNGRRKYDYFGIQAFEEKDDPYVMEKIDTLFRNLLTNVEVWICWPPSLQHKCPSKPKKEQENMEVDEKQQLPKTVLQSGSSESNLSKKSAKLKNSDNQDRRATIEVEQKMTAQPLPDEDEAWEKYVDHPLPEVVNDASETSESDWSMRNQTTETPAEPGDSSWDDSEFGTKLDDAMNAEEYAAAEKKKSREKKEANQLMRQKEKQDRKSVGSKSCVTEFQGDLFEVDDSISLAHCVGADFRMGSGIAVRFRQNFNSVPELLNQRVYQGGVAVIQHGKRHIFYLVTKNESTGKPTIVTMEKSLRALHTKCKQLNITELAMPRIGCGLDRLSWDKVKSLIEEIFSDGFSIKVYNLEKDYQETPKSKPKTTIKIEAKYLKHIDRGTALICIGSEDMFITEEMKSLDTVYCFLMRLDKGKKELGTVVSVKACPFEIVYILICKKNAKDPLDYVAMSRSIKQLRKLIKNDEYVYMGIQAFVDKHDPEVMGKIDTMFRYSYIEAEFWICYPPEIKDSLYRSSLPNNERKSWRETTTNYQPPGMLQEMQLTLTTVNLKLHDMDEKLKKAIDSGESRTERIMNQTSSEIHELREAILNLTTKMETWEPRHIRERFENLEERLGVQEARNRNLEATIENLEQRLQKLEIATPTSSSTYGSGQSRRPYKSNGGYSRSGYLTAPLPLVHNLTTTQVYPGVYYEDRLPVFQPVDNEIHEHYKYPSPADFQNPNPNPNYAMPMFAAESSRYERDALLRNTKKVAQRHGYKVTECNGHISVRTDGHSQPFTINSYDDLNALDNLSA